MKKKDLIKGSIRIGVAALLIAIPLLFQKVLPSYWISSAFKPISRSITHALSLIFNPMPFSVSEILLYVLIIATLVYIIISLAKGSKRKTLLSTGYRCISNIALVAGSLFFVFNLFWGLNYFSLSLADEIGIDVGRYSVETLYLTVESFVDELNAIAEDVPRTKEGVSKFGPFSALSQMAGEGWNLLVESNPAFVGSRPSRAKPVIASKAMSYAGITGIYIPFTGEANVNIDIPDSSVPFTISHELAHQAGVAPENEANYAAFLACRLNPNAEYRYSGYMAAFVYTYNALVKEDAEGAYLLRNNLDWRVQADLNARYAYWKQFEGKINTAATKMNNTYLMAMSQSQGVKSYGMVVDLLIADYVSHNGNPDLE